MAPKKKRRPSKNEARIAELEHRVAELSVVPTGAWVELAGRVKEAAEMIREEPLGIDEEEIEADAGGLERALQRALIEHDDRLGRLQSLEVAVANLLAAEERVPDLFEMQELRLAMDEVQKSHERSVPHSQAGDLASAYLSLIVQRVSEGEDAEFAFQSVLHIVNDLSQHLRQLRQQLVRG